LFVDAKLCFVVGWWILDRLYLAEQIRTGCFKGHNKSNRDRQETSYRSNISYDKSIISNFFLNITINNFTDVCDLQKLASFLDHSVYINISIKWNCCVDISDEKKNILKAKGTFMHTYRNDENQNCYFKLLLITLGSVLLWFL
jgi:hypothetical protein